MQTRSIVWFRQDLRLTDHPALQAAVENGHILPIYILDDENAKQDKMGGAARWWLHHSLTALDKELKHHLHVYQGDAKKILLEIAKRNEITDIYWTRCYEPWRIKRDEMIKKQCKEKEIDCHSFNGSLLWEPWQVTKNDNKPYKVFTPFYRHCQQVLSPRKPIDAPQHIHFIQDKNKKMAIKDLQLLPKISWDKGLQEAWEVGSQAAQKKLDEFLDEKLTHYQIERDFPAKQCSSGLSAHLHFGEISPNQAWYAVDAQGRKSEKNIASFLRELCWRDFCYNLLYYFPTLPRENLQEKFDAFPWKKNKKYLTCWQKGQTGYPIIDAGMRQLWQTGYMHNRVRMITGSFLVKNLLLDWRQGAQWFWDCLIDGDMANNNTNWQWVAGCGTDATPYFRIFNPVTQAEKFDPQGEYIRHFVPELAKLPKRYLACPWEAPESVLKEANIVLGKDYPHPIVDLKASREQALDAFKSL